MRAAGGGGSGRALPWAACEGWEAKVAACTRLLAPHGGTVVRVRVRVRVRVTVRVRVRGRGR